MNQSRSLDAITNQLMNSSQMKDLPPHEIKLILNKFKKLYSQQMSKVFVELNRRNKVKNNKTQIQTKQQKETKLIQQIVLKKMQEHKQKRQKAFSKKVSHFKMLDQSWKQKIEQINRKKKQENRQSLQKATQYRKQAETFWAESKKRNKSAISESKVQTLKSQANFTIKQQVQSSIKPVIKGDQFYQNKRKSQSKNQLSNVNKTLLPTIEKHSYYLGTPQSKINKKIIMHKSYHKFVDDRMIQQHIEKSKNLANEKEELILHKALEKMRMIQEKRNKCRQERQKSIKQTKQKRSLRQDAVAHAEKKKRTQEQLSQSKNANERLTHRNIKSSLDGNQNSRSKSINLINSSLNQSIIRHKQAKWQLEEQEFSQRGQMQRTNIMKQKKGKMLRLVKQTIKKMRKQTLNKY